MRIGRGTSPPDFCFRSCLTMDIHRNRRGSLSLPQKSGKKRIEIAKPPVRAEVILRDPAAQSSLTVRTQSVDAANGLPRPCGARSFEFTSIEIARSGSDAAIHSELAVQSSPDRQDSVRRHRQWTASLRSQFRCYSHRRCPAAISGLPRPCRGSQLRFRPVPAAKKNSL